MHIVLVRIKVKPESINDFIAGCKINAQSSIKEAGIHRFDFLQETEDPTRFIILEVYKTPEDQLKHRETSHYLAWKEKVESMQAENRYSIKCKNIFPLDDAWEKN